MLHSDIKAFMHTWLENQKYRECVKILDFTRIKDASTFGQPYEGRVLQQVGQKLKVTKSQVLLLSLCSEPYIPTIWTLAMV